MSGLLRRARKLAAICRDPVGILGRARYVFVVSHMRSRSSLLAHILGSHPGVAGYFEQHRPYRDWRDLLDLRLTARRETGASVAGKQLLDQVLHNRHEIVPAVLRRDHVRCIFLLRPPAPAIDSLLRLRTKPRWEPFHRPEFATAYYVERLERIAAYARIGPRHAAVVHSDALVEDPERVLEELSQSLGLSPGLSARYTIFPRTGEPLTGDSSPHIRAGRVVDTRRPLEFALAPDLLQRSQAAYEACCAALQRYERTSRHAPT